jgi:ATP-dependent DNA ligase
MAARTEVRWLSNALPCRSWTRDVLESERERLDRKISQRHRCYEVIGESHDCDPLDGEIVIVDAHGRSSFQKLQHAMGKGMTSGFAYEVFDLIYL